MMDEWKGSNTATVFGGWGAEEQAIRRGGQGASKVRGSEGGKGGGGWLCNHALSLRPTTDAPHIGWLRVR